MAEAESTLYSLLSNEATVTAIVGDRIHPLPADEEVDLPLICYERTDTDPLITIDMSTQKDLVTMDIHCLRVGRQAANDLARVVSTFLVSQGWMPVDKKTGFDKQNGEAFDFTTLTFKYWE